MLIPGAQCVLNLQAALPPHKGDAQGRRGQGGQEPACPPPPQDAMDHEEDFSLTCLLKEEFQKREVSPPVVSPPQAPPSPLPLHQAQAMCWARLAGED